LWPPIADVTSYREEYAPVTTERNRMQYLDEDGYPVIYGDSLLEPVHLGREIADAISKVANASRKVREVLGDRVDVSGSRS
jgi:hypothetical protein